MPSAADPVTIRALESPADLRACVALQEATWGVGFSERVPYAVLWFARRIGGVLIGAFLGDELVGFVFGMTGYRDGCPRHWSDMLAVRADVRDHGLGLRLKAAQRDALLQAGVATANWTFDPLESRNAHVNFARLGAIAREYLRDVYGDSDSPLHGVIGTDRLVVEWPLASERVVERLQRPEQRRRPRIDSLPIINAVAIQGSIVETRPPDEGIDADRAALLIPASIQHIKHAAPDVARAWRTHTRSAFEAYLSRGYVVTEMERRDELVSVYVLERGGP